MEFIKIQSLISILLFASLLLISCTSTNMKPDENIYRNQDGTLRWGGPPAADGAGMLFVVDETEFGAPGTPEDYPEFFSEDQYEIEVRADFKLTGKDTIRGWGATFPEIEFINIEKI